MESFDCSISEFDEFNNDNEINEGLKIIIGDESSDIKENEQVKIIRIVKPLRIGNLLDRVMKIIKLYQKSAGIPATVRFGDYDFIPEEERLENIKTGKVVNLTDKEKEILFILLGNNGKEIDRKTLLEEIWGFVEGVETHTVETHIYRLRQKIEPDPSSPIYIVTSEKGYRFGEDSDISE